MVCLPLLTAAAVAAAARITAANQAKQGGGATLRFSIFGLEFDKKLWYNEKHGSKEAFDRGNKTAVFVGGI